MLLSVSRLVAPKPRLAFATPKPSFALRNFFTRSIVRSSNGSRASNDENSILGSIQSLSQKVNPGQTASQDWGTRSSADSHSDFQLGEASGYSGYTRGGFRGRGGREARGGSGRSYQQRRNERSSDSFGREDQLDSFEDDGDRRGGFGAKRFGSGRGGFGGRGGRGGGGRGRGGRGGMQRGTSARPQTSTYVLEAYLQQQRDGVKTDISDIAPAAEKGTSANGNASPVTPIGTQREAKIERMEQAVKVTGANIPPPLDNFSDVVKNEHLLGNIKNANYTAPTPIQKYSLPILFGRRDMLATSQTGTGKTAAFLLPILQTLLEKKQAHEKQSFSQQREARPAALVLVPTRELAVQVSEEAAKLSSGARIGVAVLYGGVGYDHQLRSLNSRCNLVVATPGRLRDIAQRAHLTYRAVEHVVLDEADRMLDMGFEDQIRDILQHNDMPPPDKRHTAMFSATFPPEIRRLAADFMRKDYAFVEVGQEGSALKTIKQDILYVPEEKKPAHLLALLKQHPNATTLVFTHTKRAADMLSTFMLNEGLSSDAIHSDRAQGARERALGRFRAGKVTILVATDIAARGLDIPSVAHVINYDCPPAIDSYVHRIGRTGRAGRDGLATTFVNENDVGIVKDLRQLLSQSNQKVPAFLSDLMYR